VKRGELHKERSLHKSFHFHFNLNTTQPSFFNQPSLQLLRTPNILAMAVTKKNKPKPKAKAAAAPTSLFASNPYSAVMHDDGNPNTPEQFDATNPDDDEMYFKAEEDVSDVSLLVFLALYPTRLIPLSRFEVSVKTSRVANGELPYIHIRSSNTFISQHHPSF
jgi:hypothetical protein